MLAQELATYILWVLNHPCNNSVACELKMVFAFLNGWEKKTKRRVIFPDMKSKLNSNLCP